MSISTVAPTEGRSGFQIIKTRNGLVNLKQETPEASASGFSFGLLYSLLTNDLVDERKAPSEAETVGSIARSRA
jgi:hypothetical protein